MDILNNATSEDLQAIERIIKGAQDEGIKLSKVKALFHLRQQQKENDLEMESKGFKRSTNENGVAMFERIIDKETFKNLLKDRLEKRLQKQSFDELTIGGSKLRFDMALAIDGYPFEIPVGEEESDYEALITTEQYMSGYYDDVIYEVFQQAQNTIENSTLEENLKSEERQEPVYSTHCMICDNGKNYFEGEQVPESCPVCGEHKNYDMLDLIALHD